MSIIYLYVKQHTITKMKYFGKTYCTNPFKYNGSGIYWKKHINAHGKEHVKTLEVWGFDDAETCTAFALSFSERNNIVESTEWANLKIENGLDGGSIKGRKDKETTRKRKSLSRTGKNHSSETLSKMSANSGRAIKVIVNGIEYSSKKNASLELFPTLKLKSGIRRINKLLGV